MAVDLSLSALQDKPYGEIARIIFENMEEDEKRFEIVRDVTRTLEERATAAWRIIDAYEEIVARFIGEGYLDRIPYAYQKFSNEVKELKGVLDTLDRLIKALLREEGLERRAHNGLRFIGITLIAQNPETEAYARTRQEEIKEQITLNRGKLVKCAQQGLDCIQEMKRALLAQFVVLFQDDLFPAQPAQQLELQHAA